MSDVAELFTRFLFVLPSFLLLFPCGVAAICSAWGIRVPGILTMYGIFFRHPDFLVVLPFVGGWFLMLQYFQVR